MTALLYYLVNSRASPEDGLGPSGEALGPSCQARAIV